MGTQHWTAKSAARCRQRLDLIAFGMGATLGVVGAFLSASIFLAPIGIPILLVAFPLLMKPIRRRDPRCI